MTTDPATKSSAEAWYEPDGTATEEGQHPHWALWDHVGRKWDPVPDADLAAAANEGRNVLPDATDDQAAVIEAWAARQDSGTAAPDIVSLTARHTRGAARQDSGTAAPDGFVRCPLCHDIERPEDIVGGVCLTCADGIAWSQNARRASISVPSDSGTAVRGEAEDYCVWEYEKDGICGAPKSAHPFREWLGHEFRSALSDSGTAVRGEAAFAQNPDVPWTDRTMYYPARSTALPPATGEGLLAQAYDDGHYDGMETHDDVGYCQHDGRKYAVLALLSPTSASTPGESDDDLTYEAHGGGGHAVGESDE